MLGCKEINGVHAKKCKIHLVEKTGTKYYLLVYASHDACEMQYNMLSLLRLRGVRVPKVVQRTEDEVLLDFVEGKTLYEELVQGPVFKVTLLAQALAKVLVGFVQAIPDKRMGNIDLRSHIVRGTSLVSMDFDCILTGNLAEEVADAICSILCEKDVPQDRKKTFIKALAADCGVDKAALEEALPQVAPILREAGKLKESDQAILALLA